MTKTKRLMIDLAEAAVRTGTAFTRPVPGAFIKRLSSEQRALLCKLKSDELANVRISSLTDSIAN